MRMVLVLDGAVYNVPIQPCSVDSDDIHIPHEHLKVLDYICNLILVFCYKTNYTTGNKMGSYTISISILRFAVMRKCVKSI